METLIKGLNFQSEGDCIWQMFVPSARRQGKVTWLTMQRLTGRLVLGVPSFNDWFAHVIATQPQSERYQALMEWVFDNLTNLQVFKMSGKPPYNLAYYVIGIGKDNNVTGIEVGATET